MAPVVTAFRDAAELDRALARHVAVRLVLGIAARGVATLAVSGGRTPVGFFEELSREPLAWSRVSVTLADERWVDPEHPDSNERLVRTHLLKNAAAAARFVPLKNAAATPEAGAGAAAAALHELPLPFEVAVLGMGEDGHTASLFPGAAELAAGLGAAASPCLAVNPPEAAHPRLSLTLGALLNSHHIVVQIAGEAKLGVIRRAFQAGPAAELPIRAIIHQRRVPVDVFWCL